MSELPQYVLDRTFNAPQELVWKAWTDPTLLPRWYGPNVETIIHKLDLKAGGLWLLEMKWGGRSNYQRAEYTEVSAPSKLVWLHSSCDASWNITASPMMANWPLILLTTVTFEAAGKATKVRLTWEPHHATAEEIACFAMAISQMDKGWTSGMELLAKLLAELQA